MIEGINFGSKKHIYPIFYFILENFEILQKRAYLGYYLAPLEIPDEYLMDNEMKTLHEEYQELLEVFKTEHQDLEELEKNKPNYQGL